MRSLFVCTALTLMFGSSHAATIVVPDDAPTIQQAVTMANDFDVIVVKAGIYEENVVIAGAGNLTLRAKGKVILDARPLGSAGQGPGISIVSPGCTIDGFEIRHAKTSFINDGNAVRVLGANTTLRRLVMRHCANAAIIGNANEVSIRDCSIIGSGAGIELTGHMIEVVKTSVRMSADTAIQITGNDAIVRQCTIDQVSAGRGIEIVGAMARIEKSRVDTTNFEGILVVGASATIVGNRVTGMDNDAEGIQLEDGVNGTISKNTVRKCAQSGIIVVDLCDGTTIDSNKVQDCGLEDSTGIEVESPLCVVTKNNVRSADGDGINVDKDGCTLTANVIRDCGGDGIDVSGANVVVQKNVCIGNLGEGIEIASTNTTFEGNVMKKNRIDLATTGTFATNVGNTFKTGGVGTQPEIN